MATASGFTTDPAEFGKYHPNPVSAPQRVGPGAYLISGARSFAVTNLGSVDGDVTVDGVGLPSGFGYESEILPLGQVFADVNVVVTGGEAFISRTT